MATNEHDKANSKPPMAPARRAPGEDGDKKPAPEFSVTAVAERLPEAKEPDPSLPQDRKAAEAEVGKLHKQYDDLAEQTRLAAGDPVKQNGLKAQKGEVTRRIDAIKRQHDLA